MKLYTPGHNIVTDTLIMHGIVRYLMWLGVREGSVERTGERYIIEVKETRWGGEERPRELDTIRSLLDVEETRLVSKIEASTVNRSVVKSWISRLNRSIKSFKSIDVYRDIDHRVSSREGREKKQRGKSRGVDSLLYLPLGPLYGKYSSSSYYEPGFEEMNYYVCDTCFLMANLGLLYGSYVLRYVLRRDKASGGKRRTISIMISLAPRERAELRDVLVIQRAFELQYRRLGGERGRTEIPFLVAPLVALSFGETLYALDTDIDAVVWVYEQSGGSQRIPLTTIINASSLLEAVAWIKHYVPRWPRLLSDCFLCQEERCSATPLLPLVENILNGTVHDNIYIIVREIHSYISQLLKKDKDEKRYGICREVLRKGFIKALTKIRG